VSERDRLLESERAARTDAERALRSKDDFLSTISHELRTPLNAILGWAQLLMHANDAHIQTQGLEAIERGAKTQAKLIEDLLDASRMSSGKMRLELAILDLNSLVNASLDSLRLTANAKSIQLSLTLDSDAGPVLGDPSRLHQVVTNLLSNALKFTPVGGRVQMHVRRVDAAIELSVEDNGIGIATEFLPYVFERFRQGDSSAAREHGGLGLGLAIVRHLVLLHGGTVSAYSEGIGMGSTFTVRLPIAAARPVIASKTGRDDQAVEKLSGIRVLVVDDDSDSCEIVKRILVDSNAEVATATSADEGLAAIERFRPDLLISDIGMPGKDGYALIREIRSSPVIASKTLPAVALTAFARSQDRIQSLQAGFSMHISKPVDPRELVHVVGALARDAAMVRRAAPGA
jgi:CheY-like chemotaxis protein/two-component sensor histidine kinase